MFIAYINFRVYHFTFLHISFALMSFQTLTILFLLNYSYIQLQSFHISIFIKLFIHSIIIISYQVRLNEIPLEVSSSKVIAITDGSKPEICTIDIGTVRYWGHNFSNYESLQFLNSFKFSFSATILNTSTKNVRTVTFLSAIEHFVKTFNKYGTNAFTQTKSLISFIPNDVNEIVVLNDGNTVKFGNPNPIQMTLWEAALDLQIISSNRLQVMDMSNIQNDELLKRKILLECSVCIGMNSLVTEYIQGARVDEETGAENFILNEVVAVQQWSIGTNISRNSIDVGGLNAPKIIDDIETCSKLSLKEHLELQIGNFLFSHVARLLMQKKGPGIQANAIRDIPALTQLKYNALLNDIQCLGSLVEALLRRKESQAENFLQETDAETEHDLIVEYINLQLLEIQSLSQMLQLCMRSCEHPDVSLTYLLLTPQSKYSRESCRVSQDFKIKHWIPEHIDLIGDERNQTFLFDELVARLEEPNCHSRIRSIQKLSDHNIFISISELLMLPLASVRYSKSFENAKTQLSIAHSIVIHVLLDSFLSTINPENIDIEKLNNFATDLGDSANLPSNIQQGIVALWKIDHGIDLEQAVDSLCAPKVNISADVVMFYQITRILLLSTGHKNLIPAKSFLIYFTPFKETLEPLKGIIALSVAMSTCDNWDIGWHTTRRLCTYLDNNLACEVRKQVALLLCKWSIWHKNLVAFLNTVMKDEEQVQVQEYLNLYANHEIKNRDENAYFVDITVLWLLRLEKFDDAKELHIRRKESLRAASDRSSVDKRETIIDNMLRFPSISSRNYNIFNTENDQYFKRASELNMI